MVDNEEGHSRRKKKNVFSRSRVGRPKKILDCSITRGEEKICNMEGIDHALQKGSDEGSDIESVIESMSAQWQGIKDAELRADVTSTDAKTYQRSELWHGVADEAETGK